MTKPFYVSASQWKTADLCLRKWVFERVLKLPVYKAGYFGFGVVLHRCAERYLNSERDLFPTDWDVDPETNVRLDPVDAQLVVVLINKAIEEGVLERRPGGETEKKFEFEVLPGVAVTGYIDYRTWDQVEDHKSSKSKRYLLSPKKLLNCIQMNTYGMERLEAAKKANRPPPPVITYRHNQLVKGNVGQWEPDDPRTELPSVKKTEAETTPHRIETFWREKIIPLTKKMLAAMTVESPFDIEDPPRSSCEAYGGCPFTSLCSGGESIDSYTKRISFMLEQQQKSTKAAPTVSVTDFLNKRKAAREQTVPTSAPQINPPKEQPKAAAPVAQVEDDGDQIPPPWFSDKCTICRAKTINKGFNAQNGKHCRMCVTLSKVSADAYTYETLDDGRIMWSDGTVKAAPKAAAAPARKVYTTELVIGEMEAAETIDQLQHLMVKALELPDAEERPVVCEMIKERIAELRAAEQQAAEPEPEDTTAEVVVTHGNQPASEEQPKRRRQKKTPEPEASADAKVITSSPDEGAKGPGAGLIVVFGCSINKPWPGRDVVGAEEMLANTEGYYSNRDVFARRDALRSKILDNREEWSKALSNTVIIATVHDLDVAAFVSSLAMLPNSVVIHGVR